MEEQADKLRAEYQDLSEKLQDSSVLATKDGQNMAKRHSDLANTLNLLEAYLAAEKQLYETRKLKGSDDTELAELADKEEQELNKKLAAMKHDLEEKLQPRDPRFDNNSIVEIRAGAGGDEAALFAGDLFRMYSRYAERQGWKVELISESSAETGGFKEVIFKVAGSGAYGRLQYESGVHRVQRIPTTESSGRIHTSTATVAVLPEAEESDIEVNPADLKIDTFRSSGPGGQSVNTTDSAVRITHIPTGVVVTCQDEKSQLKNKEKALGVLRSRLLAEQMAKEAREQAEQRKSQIGTGDRSEKIRTYNFPQDRVTDHRIKLTKSNLTGILDGDINEFVSKLEEASRNN